MNYKEAEKLAQRYSLDYPGQCFWVSWNEYDEYIVTASPDFNFQDYYLNGDLIYGEDYDYDN